MRKVALLIVGAALALCLVNPASARQADKEPTISVNGKVFEGKWAIVGERPYVSVESFGKALGLPRIHHTKHWQLADKEAGPVNPLELVVRGPKEKLPTVRFGGATMVDLMAACEALDIPVHHNFYSRVWQVGSPYKGEIMVGAWYRWMAQKHRWYQPAIDGDINLYNDDWFTDDWAEFPGSAERKMRL